MSVRLNETETIVDRMVNFFVEHEDLRTKVSRVEPPMHRDDIVMRFSCPTELVPVECTRTTVHDPWRLSVLLPLCGTSLYARSQAIRSEEHTARLQCGAGAAQLGALLRGLQGRLGRTLQLQVPAGDLCHGSHLHEGKLDMDIYMVYTCF